MATTTRETTLLPSASRTTATTVNVDNEGGHRGVVVFIDLSTFGAGSSLTFTIQGKSTLSDEYYTILASAAIIAAGNTILRVFPGSTVTANLAANDQLPAVWRLDVAVGNATANTYSVNAILLP